MGIPVTPDISSLFDSYGRQARLFPGLLTIFPPLLAVLAWFPWLIVSNVGGTLLTLGTSCGLLYALATYARTKGKRIETKLVKIWGGWPTTQLLRHRGNLDIHTRRRYHQFLTTAVPNLVFPSAAQEETDPAAADDIYASAVAWLRERTRGKEFSMILRENAQYGFRRNLRGLKPVGILICTMVLIVSFSAVTLNNPGLVDLARKSDWLGIAGVLRHLGIAILAALGVNVLAILAWIFVVTKRWVREGAFQYATALLASCDQIPLLKPKG